MTDNLRTVLFPEEKVPITFYVGVVLLHTSFNREKRENCTKKKRVNVNMRYVQY